MEDIKSLLKRIAKASEYISNKPTIIPPSRSSTIAVTNPDGSNITSPNTHVTAALLGDSLSGRHFYGDPNQFSPTEEGWWNWANRFIGSPYVFQVFGVGGQITKEVKTRAHFIPDSIKVWLICTGVNDITAIAKNYATPLAKAADVEADLTAIIQMAVAKGAVPVLCTIPPRGMDRVNANSCSGAAGANSRVTMLRAVNTWITDTAPGLGAVVVDLHGALWDSTQADDEFVKVGYCSGDAGAIANDRTVAGGSTEDTVTLSSTASVTAGMAIEFSTTRQYAIITDVLDAGTVTIDRSLTVYGGEAVKICNDYVHGTNLYGLAGGLVAKTALKEVYSRVQRDYNLYEQFSPQNYGTPNYTALTGTSGSTGGGTPNPVIVSGAMATGYNVQREAGQIPRLTYVKSEYTADTTNMVGPWVSGWVASPVYDEAYGPNWQQVAITVDDEYLIGTAVDDGGGNTVQDVTGANGTSTLAVGNLVRWHTTDATRLCTNRDNDGTEAGTAFTVAQTVNTTTGENVYAKGYTTVQWYSSATTILGRTQNLFNGGANPGDELFAELEIEVVGQPVGLLGISNAIYVDWTNGTSPADLAYINGTSILARTGTVTNYQLLPIDSLIPDGYRAVLRTSVIKIPENIAAGTNGTVKHRFYVLFDNVTASRAATIKFARPVFWKKTTSRIF